MIDTKALTTSAGDQFANLWPYGLLAFLASLASLLTCYITIVASVFEPSQMLTLNPHVQAVIMWGFGLLALGALTRDRLQHGRSYPLAIAAAGVAVMVATLYVHYDQRFEMLAFVLLFAGALLNQKAMIAMLYDQVRQQAAEIGELNRNLEQRVDQQDIEIGRLQRLKTFLPAPIAELVVQSDDPGLLESHRRYIACMVCDIRGFTRFSDTAEPEETIALLRDYHSALGELAAQHHGTINYRAGDGIMVIFNDPVPCEQPVLSALRLAEDIRERWKTLRTPWLRLGHPIGIGIGIASGYATLGLLGDELRTDYTAIGNVVNLAARLCDLARDEEILLDHRARIEVEASVSLEAREPEPVKGFETPVRSYCFLGRDDEVSMTSDPQG